MFSQDAVSQVSSSLLMEIRDSISAQKAAGFVQFVLLHQLL